MGAGISSSSCANRSCAYFKSQSASFSVGRRFSSRTLRRKRRVDVVQLGSARERIEPDIAVALALVHGTQTQAPLEEEAERALGRLLEFGHRVDVAGGARVERRSRLRHVAVELGECRAVALPFRQAPARDVRERRIDGARPVFSSAGDGAEPPRGRGETSVAIGRHRGLRFAERLLHVLVREGLVPLLQPVGLQHQPGGERLAELARVAARVAEGGVRARDGEPAQHAVHRFVDAIGRALQVLRDPRALLVQQHRVFGRTGEDASFLEADDEEVGATGVARLRQAARVEMTGPWAFGRDRERLHALPHEAQRFGERTGEVAKRAQFADVFRERRSGPMIQRVAARRAMFEERQYARPRRPAAQRFHPWRAQGWSPPAR